MTEKGTFKRFSKKSILAFAVAGVSSLLHAQHARAAVYYWDASTSASWNTAANWSTLAGSNSASALVPSTADTVTFNTTALNATSEALTLDGNQSVSNMIFNSTGTTTISQGSSGTLTMATGLTLNSGAGLVTISAPLAINGSESWSAAAGTTLTLSGALTRNVGATVDFSTTGTFNGAGLIAATSSTLASGWATIGGTNWAINDGAKIIALTNYATATAATTTAAGTTVTNYTGKDIDVTSSPGVLAGAVTINSIRFNTAAADTFTLTGTNIITSGGILVTSAVGNNLSTITGGTLEGANTKDLVIIQNNTSNGLTIASLIANNTGTTGLTKTGLGTLTLTNAGSSFTGNVLISAGTLVVNASDNIGNATASALGNPQTAGRTITVASGATLNFLSDNSLGNGNSTPLVALIDSGTITNTSGSPNPIGSLTLNGGVLTATPGGGSSFNTYQSYVLTNTIAAIGTTQSVMSTTATVNNGFHLGAGTTTANITFNVDPNSTGASLLVSAPLIWGSGGTTGGALTKTGPGTLTLTGNNAYTNATTIENGVLNVAALAAGGSNSSIGAGAVAGANLVFGGGTLQYTATTGATSTNRLFTIGDANGNKATLDSSSAIGADTLSFTGTTAVLFGNTSAHTLTLTGSNVGTSSVFNTFAPIIGDNTGLTAVVKSGPGAWSLSGSNTYTGTTSVNGGMLSVTGSLASGSAVTVGGANASGTPILAGTGSVIGAVTVNGYGPGAAGQLAPGVNLAGGFGGVGTLTLGGNATFNSGGSLDLDMGSSTANSDQLAVTGTLTLPNSGFLLNLADSKSSGTANQMTNGTYTLAATGGLSNFNPADFAVRNSPLRGGTYTVSQSGNNIQLIIAGTTGYAAGAGAQASIGGGGSNYDASVGLNANKTYLNAVNLNGSTLTINGVAFAGSGSGNPTSGTGNNGTAWSIAGVASATSGGTTNFTGGLATLTSTFIYGGNPGVITLSGLTAGQTYVYTIYSKGWDAAGQRLQNVTTSDGGAFTFDVDAAGLGNLSLARYTFVATGSNETLTITPQNTNNTQHFYGFSTEQVFNNSWQSGSNWSTASWSVATPNYAGSNASLGAQSAPATLNLDTNETVGHIQFDGTNAWTLSSGNSSTLTLQTDPGGVSVLGALTGTHTVSVPTILQNDIMKTGTGSLILSGTVTTNSHNINISNGTLQVNDFGGSNSGAIADNAFFIVNNAANQNLSGVISGVGSLTKMGAGSLTLTNASSSFTGNLLISAGTLVANAQTGFNATTSALGNPQTAGRTITVASGATLNILSGNTLGDGNSTPLVTLIDNGTITNTGGGVNAIGSLTLNGGVLTSTSGSPFTNYQVYVLTNTITVLGTTQSVMSTTGTGNNGFHLGANTTTGNITFNVDPNSTGASLLVSAPLIGGSGANPTTGGALTKTGAGILILSANNAYTNATTLSGGKLYVNGSLNSASAVSVAGSATLGGTGTVGGVATVASGGIIEAGQNGTGRLTIGGLTFNGTGTINFGLLNNYAVTTAINVTASNALIASGGANSLTINVASTAGTTIGNTYKLIGYAGTTLSSGAFSAYKVGSLPSRATGILVNNTNEIDLQITGTDFLVWTGAGTLANGWDTTTPNWKLNSTGSPTAYIDNPGDTVVFDDTAAGGNTTVNLNTLTVHPTSITFNNTSAGNNNYILQGSQGIADAAAPVGLTKNNSGTLTINTSNSYSGGTTINGGVVRINNANAVQNSTVVLGVTNGLVFGSGIGTFTLGGLSGGSNLALTDTGSSAVTILVGNNNATTTYSGVLSGAGSGLTKVGSGSLTLSNAANSFTGNVLVSAGMLAANAGVGFNSTTSALGNPQTAGRTITVASGATLNIQSGNTLGDGNSTPVVALIDNGTITNTSGSPNPIGSLTLNGGVLTATPGGGSSFSTYQSYVLTNTITAIGTTQSVMSTTATGFNGFHLGANTTAANITFNVDPNSTGASLLVSAPLIWGSGGTTGGALTKTGPGTLTLSSTASSFTGNLLISTGTLVANADNNVANATTSALGNPQTAGRTITVASGATLKFLSGNVLGNGVSTPLVALIDNGTITNASGGVDPIGSLTLNGGVLTATSGTSLTNFQSYVLTNTITAIGSTQSVMSTAGTVNNGFHLGSNTNTANINFNVDPNSTGASLLVSAPLIGGSNFGTGGSLTKSGPGTLILSSSNTYSGGTTVTAGTLRLNNGLSGDQQFGVVRNGGISVNTGATLNLVGAATGYGSFGSLTVAGTGSVQVTNNNANNYFNTVNIVDGGTINLGSSGNVLISATALNSTGAGNTTNTITGGQFSPRGLLTMNVARGTAGTDLSIASPIVQDQGTTSLTKSGTGILTLSGASTYTGGTTITAGKMIVANSTGSATGTGTVTIASGATLAGSTVSSQGFIGGQVNINSSGTLAAFNLAQLTLSGGLAFANTTISSFNLTGTPNGTANALVNITGGIFTTGGVNATTINITGTPQIGTYDIFGFSGSLPALNSFQIGTNSTGFQATLVYGTNQIDLVEVQPLTWTGSAGSAGTGNWDASSLNWATNVPAATAFTNTDPVTFQDTNPIPGNANVTNFNVVIQAGGVSPGSVAFINNNINYTLGNASGTLGISGSGSVTKSGTGTVTLNSANTYTGGTTVNAGILQVNVDHALGGNGTATTTTVTSGGELLLSNVAYGSTQNLSLAGTGTLAGAGVLAATGTSSFAGNITLSDNSTIGAASGSNLTLSGSLTLGGQGLTLAGPGTITLNGAINGVTGSTFDVNGATVNLNSGAGYAGTTTVENNGLLKLGTSGNLPFGNGTPNLVIQTGGTLDINGAISLVSAITLSSGTITDASVGSTGNLAATSVTVNGSGNAINATVNPSAGIALSTLSSLTIGATGNVTTPTVNVGTNANLVVNGSVMADVNLGDGASLSGTGNITNAGNGASLGNNNTLSSTGTLAIDFVTVNGTGNQITSGTVATSVGVTIGTSASLAVNSGATLGGGGSVAVSTTGILSGAGTIHGSVDVQSGGHIAPGDSAVGTMAIDNLTLEGGSILDFEFKTGPAANDMINVATTAGLTLTGSGIGFNLYQVGTTSPFSTFGTYHLIGYTSSFSGSLSNLSVLDQAGGDSYTFSNNTSMHDIDLTIAAGDSSHFTIPNPVNVNVLLHGNAAAVVTNDGGSIGSYNTSNASGLSIVTGGSGSLASGNTGRIVLAFAGNNVYGGTSSGSFTITNANPGLSANTENVTVNATYGTATANNTDYDYTHSTPAIPTPSQLSHNLNANNDPLFLANNALTADVTAGAPYDGLSSTVTGTTNGGTFLTTTATILKGNAGVAQTVTMNWRNRSASETRPTQTVGPMAHPNEFLISDVVLVTGMGLNGDNSSLHVQTDIFALSMSYLPSDLPGNETTVANSGGLYLGWLSPATNTWLNAVAGDFGGMSVSEGFQGAEAFSTYFNNNGNLSNDLGAWGVDTTNHTVWAVLDHNSEFGVVVPEPTSLGLLGLGALGLLRRKQPKRK